MAVKLTHQEFINRCKRKYGDFYDYSETVYINAKTKIKIICPKHGEFFQLADNFINGHGCQKCSNRYKPTTDEFIQEASKIHNNFYDYSETVYKNCDSKIKIICPKHGVFLQTPYRHLNEKHGCPICRNDSIGDKLRKSTFQFIQEASKIHNNFYDYSETVYIDAHSKIKIICPKHGEFLQKPNNHLTGKGCPKCASSHGEKEIIKYFSNKKIDIEHQKKFIDCKDKLCLPFDIFVPSRNLLIEYQGEQHYKPSKLFKMTRRDFILLKHHDWLKRKYALTNGYNFLEIKYDENVQDVLDSYLKEIPLTSVS